MCAFCLLIAFQNSIAQSISPIANTSLSDGAGSSPAMVLGYNIQTPSAMVLFADERYGGKGTVRMLSGNAWKTLGQEGFTAGRIKDPAIDIYWFYSRPYILFADSENGNKATLMAISDYNSTATWTKKTSTYPVSLGTGILSKGAASNCTLYSFDKQFYAIFCDEGNGGKITTLYHGANYGKNPIYDAFYDFGPASTGRASYVKAAYGKSLYLAFADGDYQNKATVRKHTTDGWVYEGSPGFSEGAASYTSIALSAYVPYVAYIDSALGNRAFVKKYNTTTQKWETLGGALSESEASHTCITATGTDLNVAFYDKAANQTKFVRLNSTKDGWVDVLTNPLPKGTIPYQSFYEPAGRFLLSTEQFFGNAVTVRKVNSNSTSSWAELVGKEYLTPYKATQSALSTTGGYPYITYSDLTNGGKAALRAGVINGVSFNFSEGKAGTPAITVKGTIRYVAFKDYTNGEKIMVKAQPTNNYANPAISIGKGPVSPTAADYPSIASANDIFVAYQDTSDKKITVKKLNPTDSLWVTVGQTSFAKGKDITLKLLNNVPYISFTDISGGENSYSAKVMRLNPANNLWELVANGSFPNAIAGYSSLDFANNTPYIAYQDLNSGGKATVKRLNKSGTAWETAGTTGFSAAKADYISVAINGITPFVIYQDHSKNKKATLTRLNPDTNTWLVVDSAGFSKWVAEYTSITFSGSKAFLAYSSEGVIVQNVETNLPMIDSFSPDSSAIGTTVNITGKNFSNASEVSFGGVPATSFTVNSATSITAVVGAAKSGAVSVKTPFGITEKPELKFKATAAITSFEPHEAGEGTEITFHGSKFNNVTAVHFGDSSATSFKVLSDSLITAVVGKGTSGNVAIAADGGTAEYGGFSFIAPPSIAAVSPANGAAGDTVVISGDSFNGVRSVKFGGVDAKSYEVRSTDTIIAVLGSGVSGIVTIQAAGGTGSKSGFTFYGIPSISSFYPALAAKGDTVKITGTNLTAARAVSFGKTAATSFVVNSATSISAVVGAGSSGTVSVTAPGGTANRTGFSFIPAPTITSFSPLSAASGSKVTIIGSNFTGAKSAILGGVPVKSLTVNSASSISVIVGGGASGNVSITAPGGTVSKSGFTYLAAPIVQSFSPISAANTQTVTVKGSRFTGATSVKFGTIKASSFNVVSDSVLTAVVGKGTSGSISITSPGGTTSISGFIFIAAPTITSFTPTVAGAGTKVTIIGTNFSNASSVSFGGVPASSYTVNASNRITAVVAKGYTGAISVSTTGGTVNRNGFTFLDEPSILSFSPVSAGKGTTVTLTGTNFKNVTAVKFGGILAASFRVVSPTTLTAVLNAGTSGPISITTGGGSASISGFNFIEAPLISSFSPLVASNGKTVTITGSNFSNATSVKFGNTLAASFTVISPTSITAVVGSGTNGSISVVTPGGSSIRNGFVFLAAPAITSFSPVNASANMKVTIRGKNFSKITSVTFGGVPALSFIVNSTTTITAVVKNGSSGEISVIGDAGTGNKDGFTYYSNLIVVSSGNSSVFEYKKLDNQSDNIVVYPNPFDKALVLDFPDKEKSGTAGIKIFFTNGSIALQGTYMIQQGTLGLNLEDLSSGIYTLLVSVDGKDFNYKIIKK